MYLLTCPSCGHQTQASFVRVGAVVTCSACQTVFQVRTTDVERKVALAGVGPSGEGGAVLDESLRGSPETPAFTTPETPPGNAPGGVASITASDIASHQSARRQAAASSSSRPAASGTRTPAASGGTASGAAANVSYAATTSVPKAVAPNYAIPAQTVHNLPPTRPAIKGHLSPAQLARQRASRRQMVMSLFLLAVTILMAAAISYGVWWKLSGPGSLPAVQPSSPPQPPATHAPSSPAGHDDQVP